MVTHYQITDDDIEQALQVASRLLESRPVATQAATA
jgi:hypothetical protein